ncbi:PKD repeat protein [Inhella inkyongensis]|uniref:PKD repeat protein n=1 Tax=Inhella inkyongensis TaxID=392593 RepID=A0A840S3D4_9BURK|nr:PKD domain-containing protein [Inhella inkyongensis]MBB5203080.1 PKD repeat protein [Inhella inkyongensis]
MNTINRLARAGLLAAALGLSACGGGGGSGPAAPVVPPEPAPVALIQQSATRAETQEFLSFNTAPGSVGTSFRWEFSDGQTATGAQVERRFEAPGSYTFTLVARNGTGLEARSNGSVLIETPAAAPARADNQLQAACSGTHCGVTLGGQYAGSGVGVWRYRNAAVTPQSVDVELSGVTDAQRVSLVFSSAAKAAAAEPPSAGASAVQAERLQAQAWQESPGHAEPADPQHARFMRRSRQELEAERQLEAASWRPYAVPESGPQRRARAAAVVGSSRVWNDLYDDVLKPVPYPSTLKQECSTPQGRRILFWLDDKHGGSDTQVSNTLALMKQGFCGDQGGYARLVALLGDVWGGVVAARPWLIQDRPGELQDVHIALLNAPKPEKGGWAGYYYPFNNSVRERSSRHVNSNEALVFFVQAQGAFADPYFYLSTLVHELTHMVNYYQRFQVRGTGHDDWLEETSAMMSEDLLAEAISPGQNKILDSRLSSYARSAADLSLPAWSDESASLNYPAGGSLAAFLNRRHGPTLAQQLVTGCGEGVQRFDSLACINSLLASRGTQLDDEWERMGASVFGGMPARHAPQSYGFPKRQFGEQILRGKDLASMDDQIRTDTLSALTQFKPGSHAHWVDTGSRSQGRWVRKGIKLPPGTTLTVVVR